MKLARLATTLVLVAAIATGLAALLIPTDAPAAPPTDSATVQLICTQGWRGSAGGTYGGVSFTISCDNGRARQRLTGTTDTTYSVRMGAESDAVAVDCFFTGDAAAVSESCGGVRLLIH